MLYRTYGAIRQVVLGLANSYATALSCVPFTTTTLRARERVLREGHHTHGNDETILFFLLFIVSFPSDNPGAIPTTQSTHQHLTHTRTHPIFLLPPPPADPNLGIPAITNPVTPPAITTPSNVYSTNLPYNQMKFDPVCSPSNVPPSPPVPIFDPPNTNPVPPVNPNYVDVPLTPSPAAKAKCDQLIDRYGLPPLRPPSFVSHCACF